ncbi:recombinase family protein, partial [Bacillus sp. GbtcB10]|uniref:recombinase family protein n=1 Tax=Bacillus sp. GbtcB10 TaxID=2824755 RepID=UPI002815B968
MAQMYTKVKVDGRRKQTVNPKEKWVVYKNHHPAIIERDLWDKIHSFEKKEKNRTKRRVSVDNELRGLVYCAHCG